ncbi:MAG: hypothetical protein NT012_02605 [Candidatus Nealsonbacteria bacterium]|nr:hypothetical protein [Candidatus Nealsonbacteria bacterium]
MLITQGKTNWKFILIVVILAAIVGGGALWFSAKKELPYQPPEIKKVDEIANWKTYRNEEYGFEIKYPESWEVLNNNPYGEILDFSFRDKKYEGSFEWPGLRITDKDLVGEFSDTKIPLRVFKKEETENEVIKIYFDERERRLYATCALYLEPAIIETCNQMLSTFRFLEEDTEDETADWKTYRNEEYGFEVRYPIDWEMQERGDGVNYAELFYLEKEVGDSQFQFIDLGVDGDWYQVTRMHSEIIIDPTDANDPDSCLSNFVNVQRGEIDFAGRKAISWKLLTEEGNVWRSHIKILNPPRDWKENNWILINYLIYDTGENCKIPVSYCSRFEGRVKVFCNTDKKDSEIVNQMLSTFRFLD